MKELIPPLLTFKLARSVRMQARTQNYTPNPLKDTITTSHSSNTDINRTKDTEILIVISRQEQIFLTLNSKKSTFSATLYAILSVNLKSSTKKNHLICSRNTFRIVHLHHHLRS